MEYEMPNPKLLGLVSLRNPGDFCSSRVSLYPDNHLISFNISRTVYPSFFALSECFLEVV